MKRKLVHYVACLLLVLSVGVLSIEARAETSGFAGGSGTADDPYLIETAAQLDSVRNDLEAHYKLTADIVFAAEDFAENGAYYNKKAGWKPIGTSSAPFTGTFDGDKHSITGLFIDISASSLGSPWGLFGSLSGATIQNLNMVDTNIASSTSQTVIGGTFYMGSICGQADNSTIIGCSNTGIIKESYAGSSYIGGVCGYASDSTISSCSNSGTATSDAGNNLIGGICGYASNSTISLCVNTSSLNGRGGSEIGGICGSVENNSKITSCSNSGAIGGYISYDRQGMAGGICGSASNSTIARCRNSEGIDLRNGTLLMVGGICGFAEDGTISVCYNTGDLYTDPFLYGECDMGGICGRAEATPLSGSMTITNCYNTGAVSGNADNCFLGGICGISDSSISVCYNIGNIYAAGGDEQVLVGGITGYMWGNAQSANCYYLDTVLGENGNSNTTNSCTEAEMQKQSTFNGFNFANVWTMEGDDNYPYPELISLPYHVNHTWVAADCGTPKTCSVCGATEGNPLGHDWIAADCDTPKTCSACGETEGARLGHSYSDKVSSELANAATCTEAATYYVQCDRCEAVSESETVAVGEENGHNWDEATCAAPKTCSACGETEGERLGHSYTTKVSDVLAEAATCTEAATYYVQCDRCEAVSESKTVVVGEALGHDWVDADCDTPKTCSVCGETEGTTLGHDWSDWQRTAEPTYVTAGTDSRACGRCSETEERDVAPTGQSIVDAVQREEKDGVLTLIGLPADIRVLTAAYLNGRMTLAWSETMLDGARIISVPVGVEWDTVQIFFLTEDYLPVARAETHVPQWLSRR